MGNFSSKPRLPNIFEAASAVLASFAVRAFGSVIVIGRSEIMHSGVSCIRFEASDSVAVSLTWDSFSVACSKGADNDSVQSVSVEQLGQMILVGP